MATETPESSDREPQNDILAAFGSVEIRVGTVRHAETFTAPRVPAIKLQIDFGNGQLLWSSAQITDRYTPEDLVGRQVLAVTNLPPRRIAGFKSQCLTLGVPDADGAVVLVRPDTAVLPGARLY